MSGEFRFAVGDLVKKRGIGIVYTVKEVGVVILGYEHKEIIRISDGFKHWFDADLFEKIEVVCQLCGQRLVA